jgi:hypothetical protein
MGPTEPREHFDGQLQLARRTVAGQGVAQPSIQLTLGPPDEPLVLLEEAPQPGMVVLPEEVRDHDGPCDAIADQMRG